MGHVVFFSLSFFWLSTARLETYRYFIITSVFWLPLGVAAIDDIFQMWIEKYRKPWLGFYFLGLMAYLFGVIGFDGFKLNEWNFIYMQKLNQQTPSEAVFQWVMEHSKTTDLIATSEYQIAFDLDRPLVSLPEGRAVNDTNMKRFLMIYRPEYILIGRRFLGPYKRFLDNNCHEEQLPVSLHHFFVVYRCHIME
jgi:hypothetical protein